jgi:replicative DNA helicase
VTEIHLPPHHEQAERYAIGTLLNNPMSEQAATLYARMTPDDYYFSVNGKIFEHCKRLFIAGGQFDARTVYQELAKEAQDSGGPAKDCTKEYINELLELEVGNVEYYAAIICDKATRRRGIHLCTELIQRLRDTNEPSAELIAEFETRIFTITAEQPTNTTKHIADVMRSTLERIDERNTPGAKTDGIDTGFPVLNRWLSGGGWRPNRFVVIGARPGVGKTSIGISHAIAAAKAGFPTLFFSLEMTAEELAERILAMEADVPLNKIIGDLQIDQHMGRLINAAF